MVTATRPEQKVKIGPTKLLINNKWVESFSGKHYSRIVVQGVPFIAVSRKKLCLN